LKKLEKYIIELRSDGKPGADVANMLDSMPRGGLRHLKNLSIQMWGCLPLEIGSLSSLEELDIYRKSERLPDEIGCLSNLKVFRIIWDNMICSLPPTIGRLQNLEKLTVGFCKEF
jgi:Leucine-rich repeat (LRR) protein